MSDDTWGRGFEDLVVSYNLGFLVGYAASPLRADEWADFVAAAERGGFPVYCPRAIPWAWRRGFIAGATATGREIEGPAAIWPPYPTSEGAAA